MRLEVAGDLVLKETMTEVGERVVTTGLVIGEEALVLFSWESWSCWTTRGTAVARVRTVTTGSITEAIDLMGIPQREL